MPYAQGVRHQTGKQCLAGTREKLLDDIKDWIDNPKDNGPKLCLLTGLSGSGKSSVAHSIAEHYHQLKRLGSSFCFNKGKILSKLLFTTLAKDLAQFDRDFKHSLVNSIGNNASLQSVQDVNDQVQNFIISPMQNLTFVGPIVIVIDALDESGILGYRIELLRLLITLSKLPSNFRILLTSRPEEDVLKTLVPNPNVHHLKMGDVAKESTDKDILQFVSSQLTDELGMPLSTFQDQHYRTLVKKSEGLFQWAYLACSVIKGQMGGRSLNREMLWRYKQLTSNSSQELHHEKGVLDELYDVVLSQIIVEPEADGANERLKTLRALLGQILAAFQPLSANSLIRMYTMIPGLDLTLTEDIGWALGKLGALLTGVSDPSEPIRFIHSSFRDFVTTKTKSGKFYVEDLSQHHQLFVQGALYTLNQKLEFNMCQIPSSYYANSDVPGLKKRIAAYFDPWSKYAVQYWAMHLETILFDPPLECLIQLLLERKLLFWLEALSLLDIVNTAVGSLYAAAAYCQENGLILYILDAVRFVQMFATPLVRSVPQLYLSGIPSAPTTSIVYQEHIKLLKSVPVVHLGHTPHWPRTITSIQAHKDTVQAVAYSPDGRHIASGSNDETIRIWDAQTGQSVGTPLEGHTGWVYSVAYSPDGRHIASGSGQPVGTPLEGHTGAVDSLAYSPDGSHIASGSVDKTIRIWDAQT
ncbi:hypothetical protein FA95DRAFT_1525107, partial [Auriscalpium vulgare]